MRRLLIVIFAVLVLVSCSVEPEIDYHALASEARLEFTKKGIIVGNPSINEDSVTIPIMLLHSEAAYILDGKATQNKLVPLMWVIHSDTDTIYGNKVPDDEEKLNDMTLVWVYRYIDIKEDN